MKKATPASTTLNTVFFVVYTVIVLLIVSCSASAQNAVTTHAGSSQGFADATGTSAKFKAPTGICISPDGLYLYVADYSGHRIRRINIATKSVSTIAGSGASGYADGTSTAALFSYPSGLCISGDGTTLYVSDYGNSRIRKIILATLSVTTIAGDGTFSYADNTSGLSAAFNSPTDIVNNHDSVLYISDTENHLIRKFNIATTEVSTLAGMAGVGGFQNGIGTNAAFRLPKGMAVSEDGTTLYIADNGNNMIRSISLLTNNTTTVAGDGTPAFADNITGALAEFNAPNGVSIVPGNPTLLYIADNGNHRIRKINTVTTEVSTIAGTGAVPPASTFGDNMIGMNAKFFYPTNLVLSSDAADIYVADQGNFKIRKIKTDLTTGIAEKHNSSMYYQIFPNPASDKITITGKANTPGKITVELFDGNGKLVLSEVFFSSTAPESFSKDVSFLQQGIYMLKISADDNFMTKKIIISGK
jgi:DNA-binding beta-propeller fold protein YncE